MAQAQAPVHILRRRNANRSIREMYAEAQSELSAAAPLEAREPAEDSPKWRQLMEVEVGKILTRYRMLIGLSDPNRYKFTQASKDEAFKALFDGLAEAEEAFALRKGTKELFSFGNKIK